MIGSSVAEGVEGAEHPRRAQLFCLRKESLRMFSKVELARFQGLASNGRSCARFRWFVLLSVVTYVQCDTKQENRLCGWVYPDQLSISF
jgi:hypothetical protein